MELHPDIVIRRLGGTSAVAKICDIRPPSVSWWKASGAIPKAQLRFLKLAFPEAFIPIGKHPLDTQEPSSAAV